jgi:ubiquinone/menaquinone biosynthesis C-methylase UbiE
MGVDFDSDLGKLQRSMAESIAGTTRRNAILSELQIEPGDTIIDVGCGAGHLLTHLAKAVGGDGTVYGLDPSKAQIDQANLRCSEFENVKLIERNADNSQLPDDCCHYATSTQALEYIPDVDPALDEITRILQSGGAFVNFSILWDHFKFYGADQRLNDKIHDSFRAHCSHQMLPMELPGKLERRGFKYIKDKSLAFVITRRDRNSPARYTEDVMANFALTQGISKEEVSDWKSQLEKAEQEGRFGFTSFPVMTSGYLGRH